MRSWAWSVAAGSLSGWRWWRRHRRPIPRSIRSHISDILRSTNAETSVSALVDLLGPNVKLVAGAASKLLRPEVRGEASGRREHLAGLGVDAKIVEGLVRLFEWDGVFGISALAARRKKDPLDVTRAYTMLGEALSLDWAQQQVSRFHPTDQWERLLVAALERDFEQLRLEWLGRSRDPDPVAAAGKWIDGHRSQIDQFGRLVAQARNAGAVTAAMLGQIASQARILLSR